MKNNIMKADGVIYTLMIGYVRTLNISSCDALSVSEQYRFPAIQI